VRTSPLIAWRRTLAPPRLAATPPPAGAGEVAGVTLSRPNGHLHHHQSVSPPPLSAPPPLLGSMVLGEACCRSSPPASPPPTTGVAGWAGRLAGTNTLPGNRPISNTALSWASIVRDGVRANHSAISRQDFLVLCSLGALTPAFAFATRLVVTRSASPAPERASLGS
jgi:hypothetical protein